MQKKKKTSGEKYDHSKMDRLAVVTGQAGCIGKLQWVVVQTTQRNLAILSQAG